MFMGAMKPSQLNRQQSLKSENQLDMHFPSLE